MTFDEWNSHRDKIIAGEAMAYIDVPGRPGGYVMFKGTKPLTGYGRRYGRPKGDSILIMGFHYKKELRAWRKNPQINDELLSRSTYWTMLDRPLLRIGLPYVTVPYGKHVADYTELIWKVSDRTLKFFTKTC